MASTDLSDAEFGAVLAASGLRGVDPSGLDVAFLNRLRRGEIKFCDYEYKPGVFARLSVTMDEAAGCLRAIELDTNTLATVGPPFALGFFDCAHLLFPAGSRTIAPMTPEPWFRTVVETAGLGTIYYTQGDGNCFFRSIALLLWGSEKYHRQLRAAVVRHIASCPSLYQQGELLSAAAFEAWCVKMACEGEWADERVVLACTVLTDRPVFIWSSQNVRATGELRCINSLAMRGLPASLLDSAKREPLRLAYMNSNAHYNAIVPLPGSANATKYPLGSGRLAGVVARDRGVSVPSDALSPPIGCRLAPEWRSPVLADPTMGAADDAAAAGAVWGASAPAAAASTFAPSAGALQHMTSADAVAMAIAASLEPAAPPLGQSAASHLRGQSSSGDAVAMAIAASLEPAVPPLGHSAASHLRGQSSSADAELRLAVELSLQQQPASAPAASTPAASVPTASPATARPPAAASRDTPPPSAPALPQAWGAGGVSAPASALSGLARAPSASATGLPDQYLDLAAGF